MISNEVWAKIANKAEDDYFSLDEKERVIYNLRKVMEAVNGRGLMRLYEDSDYYYAEDSVDYLYTAGLDEVAAIIESANAMFPGGCPPEEYEERMEIIDSWDHEYDELFDQWTDDILEFASFMDVTYNKLLKAIEE